MSKTQIVEMYARRELPYRILPQHGIGCEVGTFRGDHAELLLLSRPKELHLIDWWSQVSAEKPEWKEHKQWVQARFAKNSTVIIHDGDARKILPTFDRHYFDWIYIDANHEYWAVTKDIALAVPLVKPGGILCGHDFMVQPHGWKTGVVRGVLQFLQDNPQHKLIGIGNTTYAEWAIRLGKS